MKRLLEGQGKNSPTEYDAIFKERTKKGPHWQDLRRWKVLLKHYKPRTYLIDLGCLDSRIFGMIKGGNIYYLGVDLAKQAIETMNECFGKYGSFEVGDLYKLDLEDDYAGYVVLGEVLEHLERPADAIKEAFRVLEPGGVLAISVPLEEATEPGAVDGDRHLWSYTKKDIEDLVKSYSSKVKFKVLRSKWFPYKYCWPQLICWTTKK